MTPRPPVFGEGLVEGYVHVVTKSSNSIGDLRDCQHRQPAETMNRFWRSDAALSSSETCPTSRRLDFHVNNDQERKQIEDLLPEVWNAEVSLANSTLKM